MIRSRPAGLRLPLEDTSQQQPSDRNVSFRPSARLSRASERIASGAEPSGRSAGALAARPSDTARQDKSRTSLATWLGKPNRTIVFIIVGSIHLHKRRARLTGQCASVY